MNIENDEIGRAEEELPELFGKEIDLGHVSKSSGTSSLPVWIGVSLGVAVSVFIGWRFLAPRFYPIDEANIPVIKRSTAPVKVRPSDPGGMDIPNRDRRVYARIEAGNDEPVVERLLPPPEQPMPLPNIEENDFDSFDDATTSKVEEPKSIISLIEQKRLVDEKIEPPKETKIEPPKTNTVATSKVSSGTQVAPTPTTVVAKGDWKVQLISVQEKDAAEKGLKDILAKNKNILEGIPHIIESADLGAKGTYYRVKVGAYADRAKAEELCSQLKANKQGCFVAK